MDEEKTQEFKHVHQFIVRATVFWDEPDHVEGTWMCVDTYPFFCHIYFLRKYSQFFSPVTSSESTQEARKRKRGDSGGQVDSEEDAKKKKRQSQRPNFFISIPITNTQVKIKCIFKN